MLKKYFYNRHSIFKMFFWRCNNKFAEIVTTTLNESDTQSCIIYRYFKRLLNNYCPNKHL